MCPLSQIEILIAKNYQLRVFFYSNTMLGRYEKAYFINESTKDHGASEWPKKNSSSLCLIQKHMFLTKPYSRKTSYLAKICSCKVHVVFFFFRLVEENF